MSDIICKDPFKQCDEWECKKAGACQSDVPSIEIGHLTADDYIAVGEVTEHEDGSATFELTLGSNALRTLVQVGFTSLLRDGIKSEAKEESKNV